MLASARRNNTIRPKPLTLYIAVGLRICRSKKSSNNLPPALSDQSPLSQYLFCNFNSFAGSKSLHRLENSPNQANQNEK
jgi:hypothetical protein